MDAIRARFDGKLSERLGEQGYRHSLAVAETAAALAGAYGLDSDTAFVAGMLHDWARAERAEDLLAAAAAIGIEVTATDAAVPYLLHAKVGARQLAEEFPELGEAIVEAVAAHTLGDVEMSDLARVVYIADLIEPDRRIDGIAEIRAAAGEVSLAELFARAYALSITRIVGGRRRLHPHTVAVWNAIVSEGGA
ncbi:MAG: bis(5'-nucleosyl)-tetraphosphatase (symmetrical) YqeK [Clostridiales bacterium]|nr:bis(5'-nucleosyl)-tetraphosphatase (symmetrical) YqeK [Clostridiales bacterium]